MLDTLIIFVRKLNFLNFCRNRFLKSIFETTLRCTLSTVGKMHETNLSITGGSLEPKAPCVNIWQLSAIKNCDKEPHLRCCSAKVTLYFNFFLLQMVSSKYNVYAF